MVEVTRSQAVYSHISSRDEFLQDMSLMVLAVCLASLFVLAQVDKATGTVTNDAKMVRLQFAHLVFPGPVVDLYIDGQVAVNAGRAMAELSADHIYGYMYLEPGSHSVAVVPTGEDLDQALIGPLDVTMVAGHRYTLAMMGQSNDESLKPLIIDETAELEKVGATQDYFSGRRSLPWTAKATASSTDIARPCLHAAAKAASPDLARAAATSRS